MNGMVDAGLWLRGDEGFVHGLSPAISPGWFIEPPFHHYQTAINPPFLTYHQTHHQTYHQSTMNPPLTNHYWPLPATNHHWPSAAPEVESASIGLRLRAAAGDPGLGAAKDVEAPWLVRGGYLFVMSCCWWLMISVDLWWLLMVNSWWLMMVNGRWWVVVNDWWLMVRGVWRLIFIYQWWMVMVTISNPAGIPFLDSTNVAWGSIRRSS